MDGNGHPERGGLRVKDFVEMVHPKTGGEMSCHPSAVAGWRERGWRKKTQKGIKPKPVVVAASTEEADNGI